ncbi:MAG: glycosyltransferase family 4 protein [Methanosarcinales archaeon]|nr:glycosyltransferase family 4 protein [Methanosarcinales archaeon]
MHKLNLLTIGGLLPWHPKAGGGQRYSYKLAKAIMELGHSTDYIAVNQDECTSYPQEDFIQFKSKMFLSQILDSLSFKDNDIIHLHAANETQGYCLGFGIKKIFKNNIKLIIQMHAPQVHKIPRSFGELFSIFACKTADSVFCVSNFAKKNICDSYKIPESKIKVIYAGVDESILHVERNNKKSDVPIVLFVGRLGGPRGLKGQKGIDILLQALPLILKKHDIRLKLIGSGKVDPYLSFIRKLGIEEYVEFIGFVNDEKLLEHYFNSDLFVFPSRRESFGLVLAEAMASGLPVVSTTAGAIPEVVENGETGILVQPEDPGALAGAIIHLLDDPEKMIIMGKKGKERVKQYFTWNKVATRVLDCYNEILGY